MSAMNAFLSDYGLEKSEGRYLAGQRPLFRYKAEVSILPFHPISCFSTALICRLSFIFRHSWRCCVSPAKPDCFPYLRLIGASRHRCLRFMGASRYTWAS